LELFERHQKPWSLYVFSSANALRRYSIEQLVALGISWVWLGLEGEDASYRKLDGTDTFSLVGQLQSHGIRVLGSSIIGMDDHSLSNINKVIAHAADHRTDFHQFMLYTPLPGTTLYAQLAAEGRLKDEDEFDPADIHGQLIFRHRHRLIPPGAEAKLIVRAFQRDFVQNGPSVVRIAETTLAGWRRYRNHPDARIRDRIAWEAKSLATTYAALIAATARHYRQDPTMQARLRSLLNAIVSEFGWKARMAMALGGRLLEWTISREARRLARGWSYEPCTFYEVLSA
jgi:hypothetical protein